MEFGTLGLILPRFLPSVSPLKKRKMMLRFLQRLCFMLVLIGGALIWSYYNANGLDNVLRNVTPALAGRAFFSRTSFQRAVLGGQGDPLTCRAEDLVDDESQQGDILVHVSQQSFSRLRLSITCSLPFGDRTTPHGLRQNTEPVAIVISYKNNLLSYIICQAFFLVYMSIPLVYIAYHTIRYLDEVIVDLWGIDPLGNLRRAALRAREKRQLEAANGATEDGAQVSTSPRGGFSLAQPPPPRVRLIKKREALLFIRNAGNSIRSRTSSRPEPESESGGKGEVDIVSLGAGAVERPDTNEAPICSHRVDSGSDSDDVSNVNGGTEGCYSEPSQVDTSHGEGKQEAVDCHSPSAELNEQEQDVCSSGGPFLSDAPPLGWEIRHDLHSPSVLQFSGPWEQEAEANVHPAEEEEDEEDQQDTQHHDTAFTKRPAHFYEGFGFPRCPNLSTIDEEESTGSQDSGSQHDDLGVDDHDHILPPPSPRVDALALSFANISIEEEDWCFTDSESQDEILANVDAVGTAAWDDIPTHEAGLAAQKGVLVTEQPQLSDVGSLTLRRRPSSRVLSLSVTGPGRVVDSPSNLNLNQVLVAHRAAESEPHSEHDAFVELLSAAQRFAAWNPEDSVPCIPDIAREPFSHLSECQDVSVWNTPPLPDSSSSSSSSSSPQLSSEACPRPDAYATALAEALGSDLEASLVSGIAARRRVRAPVEVREQIPSAHSGRTRKGLESSQSLPCISREWDHGADLGSLFPSSSDSKMLDEGPGDADGDDEWDSQEDGDDARSSSSGKPAWDWDVGYDQAEISEDFGFPMGIVQVDAGAVEDNLGLQKQSYGGVDFGLSTPQNERPYFSRFPHSGTFGRVRPCSPGGGQHKQRNGNELPPSFQTPPPAYSPLGLRYTQNLFPWSESNASLDCLGQEQEKEQAQEQEQERDQPSWRSQLSTENQRLDEQVRQHMQLLQPGRRSGAQHSLFLSQREHPFRRADWAPVPVTEHVTANFARRIEYGNSDAGVVDQDAVVRGCLYHQLGFGTGSFGRKNPENQGKRGPLSECKYDLKESTKFGEDGEAAVVEGTVFWDADTKAGEVEDAFVDEFSAVVYPTLNERPGANLGWGTLDDASTAPAGESIAGPAYDYEQRDSKCDGRGEEGYCFGDRAEKRAADESGGRYEGCYNDAQHEDNPHPPPEGASGANEPHPYPPYPYAYGYGYPGANPSGTWSPEYNQPSHPHPYPYGHSYGYPHSYGRPQFCGHSNPSVNSEGPENLNCPQSQDPSEYARSSGYTHPHGSGQQHFPGYSHAYGCPPQPNPYGSAYTYPPHATPSPYPYAYPYGHPPPPPPPPPTAEEQELETTAFIEELSDVERCSDYEGRESDDPDDDIFLHVGLGALDGRVEADSKAEGFMRVENGSEVFLASGTISPWNIGHSDMDGEDQRSEMSRGTILSIAESEISSLLLDPADCDIGIVESMQRAHGDNNGSPAPSCKNEPVELFSWDDGSFDWGEEPYPFGDAEQTVDQATTFPRSLPCSPPLSASPPLVDFDQVRSCSPVGLMGSSYTSPLLEPSCHFAPVFETSTPLPTSPSSPSSASSYSNAPEDFAGDSAWIPLTEFPGALSGVASFPLCGRCRRWVGRHAVYGRAYDYRVIRGAAAFREQMYESTNADVPHGIPIVTGAGREQSPEVYLPSVPVSTTYCSGPAEHSATQPPPIQTALQMKKVIHQVDGLTTDIGISTNAVGNHDSVERARQGTTGTLNPSLSRPSFLVQDLGKAQRCVSIETSFALSSASPDASFEVRISTNIGPVSTRDHGQQDLADVNVDDGAVENQSSLASQQSNTTQHGPSPNPEVPTANPQSPASADLSWSITMTDIASEFPEISGLEHEQHIGDTETQTSGGLEGLAHTGEDLSIRGHESSTSGSGPDTTRTPKSALAERALKIGEQNFASEIADHPPNDLNAVPSFDPLPSDNSSFMKQTSGSSVSEDGDDDAGAFL